MKHILDSCLINLFLASFWIYCSINVKAAELTFELPDNAKQCFYEEILGKGIPVKFEYQVITGGRYDVDAAIHGPRGNILYKQQKKQYDSYAWTSEEKGVYMFCFSNEFSTFTHKVVYFDLIIGKEKPLTKDIEAHATAMTQIESSCVSIHEALKAIVDYQTHHRMRESQGRSFAEDLFHQVNFWSVGEAIILFMIGIGQIVVLRSFFTEKRTKMGGM